jgi:hypothetical protein
MATQIQIRNGTAAEWTTDNPLLAVGEVGIENDTRKMKSGDGVTLWNSLLYMSGGSGGASTYAALTDGATVDLPTVNAPLANALAMLAPLASPTFTGTITSGAFVTEDGEISNRTGNFSSVSGNFNTDDGNFRTLTGQFTGPGTGLTGTAAGLTAGNVTTINGRLTAGANVTISGAGTAASPYSIAAAGGDPTVQFATSKATLVDADRMAIFDSAASFVPKHSLFSLVKSTLKTYFDTIYAVAAAYARTDIDTTFAQKAIITGGNLILGGVADGATGRSLLQSSTQAAAQTAIGIVTLTPAAYAALVLAGTTVPTTIYITTEP